MGRLDKQSDQRDRFAVSGLRVEMVELAALR